MFKFCLSDLVRHTKTRGLWARCEGEYNAGIFWRASVVVAKHPKTSFPPTNSGALTVEVWKIDFVN